MPHSVNGIGTHYYGKANLNKRIGTCRQCQAANATLTSYDTRLWFVIVFIPIVPLGRKRIMDECSNCQRHYQADLSKWEEMQQLGISETKAKFEQEGTVESAIGYHQTLLNFHEHERAKAVRAQLASQFADNATWHAYLGEVLSEHGTVSEVDAAYTRAFELKSELPSARVGMAQMHMRRGQLDEARQMLDFMEAPGAEQLGSLAPLEHLANAYRHSGEHAKALQLYERLMAAYPGVAKDHRFRKAVAASEKGAGVTSSALPTMGWWEGIRTGPMRPVAIGAAIVIVGIIAAVAQNFYVRGHRTLHVVNGFDDPITVSVGKETVTLAKKKFGTLALPEGEHVVQTKGALVSNRAINLESSFFDRWSDELFLFNPGGRAVVLENEVHYSAGDIPGQQRVHVGKVFERIEKVDHPFTPLPKTVQMKSSEKERVLIGLEFSDAPMQAVLNHLMMNQMFTDAMALAEATIPSDPRDDMLTGYYAAAAISAKQAPRALAFLEKQLDASPVNVGAHRSYHTFLAQDKGDAAADTILAERYQNMLRDDPQNADLLYLRGRVCSDGAEAERFYLMGIQAQPRAPWPNYGIGARNMIANNWAKAKEHLDIAAAERPGNAQFESQRFTSRMGARDFTTLADEATDVWRKEGDPYRLAEVLAAKGDMSALATAHDTVMRSWNKRPQIELDAFSAHVLLLRNEPDRALAKAHSSNTHAYAVHAHLMLGEPSRVESDKDLADLARSDSTIALGMVLSSELANDATRTKRWQKIAEDLLHAQYAQSQEALARVFATETPTLSDYLQVGLGEESNRALLAALCGLRNPAQRAEFFSEAAAANVHRVFPYHLVERALKK